MGKKSKAKAKNKAAAESTSTNTASSNEESATLDAAPAETTTVEPVDATIVHEETTAKDQIEMATENTNDNEEEQNPTNLDEGNVEETKIITTATSVPEISGEIEHDSSQDDSPRQLPIQIYKDEEEAENVQPEVEQQQQPPEQPKQQQQEQQEVKKPTVVHANNKGLFASVKSLFDYAPRPAQYPPSTERRRTPNSNNTSTPVPPSPSASSSSTTTTTTKTEAQTCPSDATKLRAAKQLPQWTAMDKLVNAASAASATGYRAAKEASNIAKEATLQSTTAQASLRRAQLCEKEATTASHAYTQVCELKQQAKTLVAECASDLQSIFQHRADSIQAIEHTLQGYAHECSTSVSVAMIAATKKAEKEHSGEFESKMRSALSLVVAAESATSIAVKAIEQAHTHEMAVTAMANARKAAHDAEEALKRAHEINSSVDNEKIAQITMELLIAADRAAARCQTLIEQGEKALIGKKHQEEQFQAAIPFIDAASKAADDASRSAMSAAYAESSALKTQESISHKTCTATQLLIASESSSQAACTAAIASVEATEYSEIARDAADKAEEMAPGSLVASKVAVHAKRAEELAAAARVSAEMCANIASKLTTIAEDASIRENQVKKCGALAREASSHEKNAAVALKMCFEARDTCKMMFQRSECMRAVESVKAANNAEEWKIKGEIAFSEVERLVELARAAAREAEELNTLAENKAAAAAKMALDHGDRALQILSQAKATQNEIVGFVEKATANSILRCEEEKKENERKKKMEEQLIGYVQACEAAIKEVGDIVDKIGSAGNEAKNAVMASDAYAAVEVGKKELEKIEEITRSVNMILKECKLMSIGRDSQLRGYVEKVINCLRDIERMKNSGLMYVKNAEVCAKRKEEREEAMSKGLGDGDADMLKYEDVAATAEMDADTELKKALFEKSKAAEAAEAGNFKALVEHVHNVAYAAALAKKAAALGAEAAGGAKHLERKLIQKFGANNTGHSSKRTVEAGEAAALHWRDAEKASNEAAKIQHQYQQRHPATLRPSTTPSSSSTTAQSTRNADSSSSSSSPASSSSSSQQQQQSSSGLVGLGMHLNWLPQEGHQVHSLLIGKAAYNSQSVQVGDVIVKIGSVDVKHRSSCKDLVTGRPGTDVELTLRKGSATGPLITVTLTRTAI